MLAPWNSKIQIPFLKRAGTHCGLIKRIYFKVGYLLITIKLQKKKFFSIYVQLSVMYIVFAKVNSLTLMSIVGHLALIGLKHLITSPVP